MTTLLGMRPFAAVICASLVALLTLAGCTTVRESFGGATADEIWAALVDVAETPRYDDWTLATNEVWVDELDQRIEIYRRVRRVLRRPGAKPHAEHRTYRFQVRLDDTDPPEAVFVSRGWGVPAHALLEGDRYFAHVRYRLGDLAPPAARDQTDSDQDLLDAMGLDDSAPVVTEPQDQPDPETLPAPE